LANSAVRSNRKSGWDVVVGMAGRLTGNGRRLTVAIGGIARLRCYQRGERDQHDDDGNHFNDRRRIRAANIPRGFNCV
jgi:hypothetical protein